MKKIIRQTAWFALLSVSVCRFTATAMELRSIRWTAGSFMPLIAARQA